MCAGAGEISGGIIPPLDAAELLAWHPRIRPRMSDGSNMDEPITARRPEAEYRLLAQTVQRRPSDRSMPVIARRLMPTRRIAARIRRREIGSGRPYVGRPAADRGRWLGYALSLLHPPVWSHILDKGFDKL